MKNFKYMFSNGRALPVGELDHNTISGVSNKRDYELSLGSIKSYVMCDCFLCTPKTSRTSTQLSTPDDIWCATCGRNFFNGHDLTNYVGFREPVEVEPESVSDEIKDKLKQMTTDYIHKSTIDESAVVFEKENGIKEYSSITRDGYLALAALALTSVAIGVVLLQLFGFEFSF